MDEFFNCLFSKHGLAYLTGIVIFIITLFLTSKKIIGFTLTLLFLIFALIASIAVSNQDLIRSYFVHSPEQPKEGVYQGNSQAKPSTSSDINSDLQRAFDDLKAEFLEEKERLEKMWDDFIKRQQSEQDSTKKESPTPE